jgi:hypothetical protein
MSKKTAILGFFLFTCVFFLSTAYAQKGVGDETGLARQAVKPALASLSGTVVYVDTKVCEKTTGHGEVGTHFLLKTEQNKTFNIDLGWSEAEVVKNLAKNLIQGKQVTIVGFRTEKMPPERYVAKSVTIAGTTTTLRDDNLRPVWAGRSAGGRGRGPGRQ